jgi:hypothetical protein
MESNLKKKLLANVILRDGPHLNTGKTRGRFSRGVAGIFLLVFMVLTLIAILELTHGF